MLKLKIVKAMSDLSGIAETSLLSYESHKAHAKRFILSNDKTMYSMFKNAEDKDWNRFLACRHGIKKLANRL